MQLGPHHCLQWLEVNLIIQPCKYIDAARNVQPKKIEGAGGVVLVNGHQVDPQCLMLVQDQTSPMVKLTPLLCRFPPKLFNTLPPSHLVSVTHPFTAIHST